MQTGISRIAFGVLCTIVASISSARKRAVLHYRGNTKLRIAGKDHMVVIAELPKSSKSIRLVVPNEDPDGGYAPAPEQSAELPRLQPNDLIQASWETDQQVNNLISLKRYDPRPGELSPHGYVFIRVEQAKPDAPDLAVILDKLGERTRAIIPCQTDADGELRCDPLISAVLAKIHEGDPVWVSMAEDPEPKVQVMEAWTDPRKGKLQKLQAIEVDGGKGVAVEISWSGNTVTAEIPGKMKDDKWIMDPHLLAAARSCRVDGFCYFRVRTVEGKDWILELDPVPDQLVGRQPAPARNGNGSGRSGTDANGLPRPRIPGGGVPGVGGVGF